MIFPCIYYHICYNRISNCSFSDNCYVESFCKSRTAGWAAIIPFYNIYIMTRIAGKPGWWVLMCFIPFVNYVFIIWLYNMISKSFGKDEAFTVGLVLLGIVFWPILGSSDAKYQGPFGDPVAYRAYQDEHKFDFERQQ